MTAEEVLSDYRSEIPSWLAEQSSLSAETLEQFLSSRVVYYPGSGEDDHAVELFGSTQAAHCFVHADYRGSNGDTAPNVQFLLGPANTRYGGYKVRVQQVLSPSDVLSLIKADSGHPWPGQESRLTGALWAVLERRPDLDNYLRQRRDALSSSEASAVPGVPSGTLGRNDSATDHKPPLIAFLHITADAVWVYDKLWACARRAPYAILLQDHGFGGNWAPFGGDRAPLRELARDCNALPPWLLVAENTPAWPGYREASELTEPRGDAGHQRRLFRLTGSDVS